MNRRIDKRDGYSSSAKLATELKAPPKGAALGMVVKTSTKNNEEVDRVH